MKDSEFISGSFFEFEVPKSRKFLLKYFRTDLQRMFLGYYLTFGNLKNFVDHTGYYCSERILMKMQKNYKRLIKCYDCAKMSLTEEGMRVVDLMESGKIRLTRLPFS